MDRENRNSRRAVDVREADREDRRQQRAPVRINTEQVLDSCKSRDCATDLRVFFTAEGQQKINEATNVKIKSAKVIWVNTTVAEIPFSPGYFTVEATYFFKVTLDAFVGFAAPEEVEGMCAFDKRVLLFGSTGMAKIFRSDPGATSPRMCEDSNLPSAVVEVVEPLVLTARLSPGGGERCGCSTALAIPFEIRAYFDDGLIAESGGNKVFVTLGLFSIIKIEREAEMLVRAIEGCVRLQPPVEEEGCGLFNRMRFPIQEFYPEQKDECLPCECYVED